MCKLISSKMQNFDQKQLREEMVFLVLYFQVPIHL